MARYDLKSALRELTKRCDANGLVSIEAHSPATPISFQDEAKLQEQRRRVERSRRRAAFSEFNA